MRVRTKRMFRISQAAVDSFDRTICELRHGDIIGYGEGAPSKRVTGEDPASVAHFLNWAAKEVADLPPDEWARFLDHVHDDICGNPGARAALDLAMHDLVAKLQGVPVRTLYDLPAAPRETSITISLGDPKAMVDEARERFAQGFRILKLKVGGLEHVRAVREALPSAALRVDANTAWSADEARRVAPQLAKLGVEMLEQPLPRDDIQGLVALSRELPLPVYADESVLDVHDVRRLHAAGFRGGISVKIQKGGGIRPAIAALRETRALGLPTQIGCNVETAIGIAAGTQLLSLVDLADLDGHLLLADTPFRGPMPERGWYATPAAAGLGVSPT